MLSPCWSWGIWILRTKLLLVALNLRRRKHFIADGWNLLVLSLMESLGRRGWEIPELVSVRTQMYGSSSKVDAEEEGLSAMSFFSNDQWWNIGSLLVKYLTNTVFGQVVKYQMSNICIILHVPRTQLLRPIDSAFLWGTIILVTTWLSVVQSWCGLDFWIV